MLVAEAVGEHVGTIIFLHGLGDTGEGWFHDISSFKTSAPGVKVICPTASKRHVTYFRKTLNAWFDKDIRNSIESTHFEGIEETVEYGTLDVLFCLLLI